MLLFIPLLFDAQSNFLPVLLTPWKTNEFAQMRLRLIKAFLGNEPLVLCLDETGDEKKGVMP